MALAVVVAAHQVLLVLAGQVFRDKEILVEIQQLRVALVVAVLEL